MGNFFWKLKLLFPNDNRLEFYIPFNIQGTLFTTTAYVPKDDVIKMNLPLYRILIEQIDM